MNEKPNGNWLTTTKIFTAISIAIFLLTFALPHKICVLVELISFSVPVYCIMVSTLKKFVIGRIVVFWVCEAVLLGMHLFIQSDYYYYIENGIKVFYLASFIIAILFWLLLYFWCREKIISFSDWFRKSATISIYVLIVAVVVLPNLNYALDLSEPQNKEVVILGKEMRENIKGPDRYELMLELDGETCFISVPESVCDEHHSGDTLQLLKYDGAFGEAFYIPKDIKN